MVETNYYIADNVGGVWVQRPEPIRARYDDEDTREAAAMRLLGSQTKDGGTVVLADLLDDDGSVTEQFEW